jgi:ubiquinone/menaquinone biosynthesis C-methylase UbiE
MNSNHARLCPSPEWAEHLRTEVLPRLCLGADLGSRVLEIGPGPGAVTDWLRQRVTHLVAVEVDAEAADALRARFPDDSVEIVTGDGAALPYPDGSFDSVASCTMLHHVPDAKRQNAILAEALRVLRPGGVLIASDSIASTQLHDFHVGDTYCPIDPASLIARLQTIGFAEVNVYVGDWWSAQAWKAREEGAA